MMEEKLEMARRGLIPTVQLGLPAKEVSPPEPPRSDRAPLFEADYKAEGPGRDLQREIAAALTALNFVPEGREAHFAWTRENEYFQNGTTRLTGWYGRIQNVARHDAGGWLVKVVVSPQIHTSGRRSLFLDHVVESYHYQDGTLLFLDSNAAIPRPELQTWPNPF